jgi:bifunctional oligoribonuclease and PAP phosphatase NrnA
MTGTIARPSVDLAAWADAVPMPVIDRIRSAKRILAAGHENPDADTLGASLAIVQIGESLGAHVTPVCADPPPSLYDFLVGADRVRSDPEAGVEYDLLVVSDCGTLERTGSLLERHGPLLRSLPRVTIDHHVSNDAAGDADWVDPAAAATCEMVALLAHRLGVPLATDQGALATNLIAGLVMDTATFQHPNTTPRTLTVAAALLEAGAPLAEISRRLYRSKPTSQLRLFGRVLNRLDSTVEGVVLWSSLLDEDLLVTGSLPSESEGIIDLMAQSTTAEVVIVFKEAGAATRISVRTRPGGVDATELTGLFGGGGHARAAGATINLTLDAARPVVLAEAERLAALVVR